MSKSKLSTDLLNKFLSHPDKSEIIQKLVMDNPIEDIYNWLAALYQNNKDLVLSKKFLTDFKNNHLDYYTIIQADVKKAYSKQIVPEEEVQFALQNNSAYQNKLKEYLNNELDIITILKKLIAKIEVRAETLFDEISDDPRNIKLDRTLIEWLNLLLSSVEKYRPILEGPTNQVNIQNNFNISVLDQHLGLISETIREILANLDYETSLLFMERYSEKMAALREVAPLPISQEKRLETAQVLSVEIQDKINSP